MKEEFDLRVRVCERVWNSSSSSISSKYGSGQCSKNQVYSMLDTTKNKNQGCKGVVRLALTRILLPACFWYIFFCFGGDFVLREGLGCCCSSSCCCCCWYHHGSRAFGGLMKMCFFFRVV